MRNTTTKKKDTQKNKSTKKHVLIPFVVVLTILLLLATAIALEGKITGLDNLNNAIYLVQTNNATDLINKVNTCTDGCYIIVPNGTYTITEALNFTNQNNMHLQCEGATIKSNDDSLNGGSMIITSNNLNYCGNTALTTLTANTTYRSTEITVADATSLKVGDFIKIVDDDVYQVTYKKQEINRIKAIDGNTLTLETQLMTSYETDKNAEIYLLDCMIENLKIDGCKFEGQSVGSNTYAMKLSHVYQGKITNNEIHDFGYAAIQTVESYDIEFSNNIIRKVNRAGLGYGIKIDDATRKIRINSNNIMNARHCIDSGGSSGEPTEIIISNNHFTSTNDTVWQGVINAHTGEDGVYFITGNTITGGEAGISLNGQRAYVTNNYIDKPKNYGIRLLYKSGGTYKDNYITDPLYGIQVENTSGELIIDGNQFYCDNLQCRVAIDIKENNEEYPRTTITDNRIYGQWNYSINASKIDNSTISNNVIDTGTYGKGGIKLTDSTNVLISGNTITNDMDYYEYDQETGNTNIHTGYNNFFGNTQLTIYRNNAIFNGAEVYIGSFGTTIGQSWTNLHVKDTTADVMVESTETGASSGSIWLVHNTTSPADNDEIGWIIAVMPNDNNQHERFVQQRWGATDVSDTAEKGTIITYLKDGGSSETIHQNTTQMALSMNLDMRNNVITNVNELCLGGTCQSSWTSGSGNQWPITTDHFYNNSGTLELNTSTDGYLGRMNTSLNNKINDVTDTNTWNTSEQMYNAVNNNTFAKIGDALQNSTSANFYRIGLGLETSPQAYLHINGSATGEKLRLSHGGLHEWSFYLTTNGDDGLGIYNRNLGTYMMHLAQTGNIGLGTDTPTHTLDVFGTIQATTLNTGQGDNELYDMDQNVQTTSDVTFDDITLTNDANMGGNDINNTKIITLTADTTNHKIYDNTTCVIITGDTTTWQIC